MDNSQLVVGSTDCSINTILSIIRPSALIRNEWPTLAMELNVKNEHIKRLRQDQLLSKITYTEVICEVIMLWKGDNGSNATLDQLLNVVEGQCGANDVGESLRLHFHLPCKAAYRNPSIVWNEISPAFQNRIIKTFQKSFPTLKFSETLPNLRGSWLIMLMIGKKPPLFVHPFPDTRCYYINRTLITRNIISTRIFEQNSQDIFLFTGMDPSELSALAGKRLTGSSSAQLRGSSTVKFIILERGHHFETICEKTNHSVHLLRKEDDGRLRWIRSKGKMDNLQKYVDQLQDEFDEVKFCRHLNSNTTSVCICDSPGMGKSVLLAQIGAELGRFYPDRTILFIVFTEFIKLIKSTKMNDDIKTIEIALQKLTGEPAIQSNINLKQTVSFELLLDGFDEVDSADYKLARSILRKMSISFKTIRLWVTSRPHLMEELETSLNLLGYNIRPFHEQDQVQFLSSFWSRSEQLDKERSEMFALKCLKSLKSKMDNSSQDIAGIPLQCLLIGEVYEKDALEYAQLDNGNAAISETEIEIGTITNLYQNLIRKKVEKYKSLKGKLREDELMAIHAQLGLELLFPDKVETLKLEPLAAGGFNELWKIGIVVKSLSMESSYAFMHRTFAEYFVAWFAVDKLRKEKEWTKEINDCFLNCILKCQDTKYIKSFEFVEPVICYFLDSFIADLRTGNNFPNICFWLDAEAELLNIILRACANKDLVYVFKIFHERYESDESYTSTIFTNDFLDHSIKQSSLELVKPVVTQLERQDRFNMEVQGEALRTAVRFGKFPILEFLIKEKQASGIVEDLRYGAEELVQHCIEGCKYCSDEEVKTRIQVLRMLIQINVTLLNGKVHGRPPLLCYFVHVKLLMELVRLGADVLAEDAHGTVLHLTVHQELSSSDYHSLVMSIPEKSLRQLVHRKGESGHTPLTSALVYIDPAPETLDMFHRVGADFKHTDSSGCSVLEFAIRSGRSAVIIRKIIQHGGTSVLEYQATTFSIMRLFSSNRRTNFLHIAAKWGNVEAVGVFADEYRIDVNWKDERGRTPLDILIESNENGDRYATGLALKERGARFNDDKALIVAVINRNLQSVRLLISLGVNVNGRDEKGHTALHKCVEPSVWYSPHFTILQLLVQSGADVTALNTLGNTPFHNALKNGNLDAKSFLLLKSKMDENDTARVTPAICDFELKLALRGKEELDEEQLISILNNYCETHEQNVCLVESNGNFAVHAAAARGHLKALQLLVEKGADINVKDKLGWTPLHVVAGYKPNGCMNMVKYLVGRADLYAKNKQDRTFLHQFILADPFFFKRSPSPSAFHFMVEYLIEAGEINLFNVSGGSCGVTNKDNCGSFPLQLAVRNLEPKIRTLERLQSCNIDFNVVDKLGHCILFNAVQGSRRVKFISTLINRFKVNWKVIDQGGWNVLHHAAFSNEYKSSDRLKFFLEIGGLDVNKLNNEGETPLFCAVNSGKKRDVLQNCKLLVAHGADVNISNKAGVTPLAVVESNFEGHDKAELMELLRNHS